jgi:teichuronic acid biosynthesis glycosyltransferase TuaG
MKTVSVVMPTHNHAQYIGEAIASVLAQSHDDLELIVVDNHSTDSTREIVERFSDSRLRYYQYRNEGIIAASRNSAIQRAAGDIVAFIDSDDEWDRHKLATQLPHLDDPEVIAVAANFRPIGEIKYCRSHLSFKRSEEYRDHSYREVALGNPVMTSSLIARKADILKTGGFDASPELAFIEDWELWLRMSRYGRIRVLAERLISFRVYGRKTRDVRKVSLNSLKMFAKHNALSYIDDDTLRIALANYAATVGKAHLDVNDRAGIPYYQEALRLSTNLRHRVRAVAGLCLFALPPKIRYQLIDCLYWLNGVRS